MTYCQSLDVNQFTMILFVLLPLLLTSSVLARLDLEPTEPDPSPETGHCSGPNCSSQEGINDPPPTPPVFTCNETETSFYADPADCHNYYICYKGNSSLQTCPPDMAYRPNVKMCVAERFVKECQLITCTNNGILPDSKNCTRYYNCFYGFPYHFTCPNGTRFDPVSRHCSSTIPCITEKNFMSMPVPVNLRNQTEINFPNLPINLQNPADTKFGPLPWDLLNPAEKDYPARPMKPEKRQPQFQY